MLCAMQSESLISNIIEKAKKQGADDADVILINSTDVMVRQRMGQPETIERSEDAGIGLRVFVGKAGGYKTATVSSSDLNEETLDLAIEQAVAMAKAAPEDKYVDFAPEDVWAKEIPDLQLDDGEELSPEKLTSLAASAEGAALQHEGITNSEGAEADYGKYKVYLATSKGFLQSYQASSLSLSVSVIAGEGQKMETDYDYTVARNLKQLKDPSAVGKEAATRALKRLNPRKVKTCQVPVIFEHRVARDLVRSFVGAINGASVARKTSFLKDKMGEQVFAKGINIFDDPLMKGGLGSHPFDGEGVASEKRHLIENGELKTWILDVRSANQLGLKTTGHASRSTSSPPSPSSSNVYLEAGEKSVEELAKDIGTGFYCTEAFGMGVNGVTGDYSQGASGFWIENGEIAYPVSELTIASNLKDMYQNLIPANDLEMLFALNSPSLLIEKMMVAGE